jgi:RNA processing factor Prp31
MSSQADYIKAAKERGLSDEFIVQSARTIEQIEKEGNYVSWQWYIAHLPEPFDE